MLSNAIHCNVLEDVKHDVTSISPVAERTYRRLRLERFLTSWRFGVPLRVPVVSCMHRPDQGKPGSRGTASRACPRTSSNH